MSAQPPVAAPIPSPSPSPAVSSALPDSDQIIAMAVIIFGFWNVPIVRNLINPLKLFTIALHEFCHIVAAVISGGRILRITIDPHIGGATIVEGGRPTFILASGYIGSTLLGGIFVLAGYDTLVAKVMSFVLGIGLIMPLALVRDKLPFALDRFVVESVIQGDVADDRFFNKTNDSDATQFALLYPRIGPHIWATIWIIFELGALAGFIVLGIYAFKLTEAEMNAQAVLGLMNERHFRLDILQLI
ncbi:hypothetical protein H0H92_013567 [Tricholoma furcatifolium]|nr:hypothetical protein H0H92_013567 [Tricholoma furcatifolium]